MADASLAGHPACDRRTVLLADPRPDRLRPVGEALARGFDVAQVAKDARQPRQRRKILSAV